MKIWLRFDTHIWVFFFSLPYLSIKSNGILLIRKKVFLSILSPWWPVFYILCNDDNFKNMYLNTYWERNTYLLLFLKINSLLSKVWKHKQKGLNLLISFSTRPLPHRLYQSAVKIMQLKHCISGICNTPCCKLLGKNFFWEEVFLLLG